jgi:hypothetical protein
MNPNMLLSPSDELPEPPALAPLLDEARRFLLVFALGVLLAGFDPPTSSIWPSASAIAGFAAFAARRSGEAAIFSDAVSVVRMSEIATPERQHTAGASTSMRRTITPLKYTAVMPYRIRNSEPADQGTRGKGLDIDWDMATKCP